MVATYDTAGSAKMIREQHMAGVAAIASERAAAVFGLETLRAGIQDHDDNTTRFLIVTRAGAAAEFIGSRPINKTTIVFTLANTPGALFKALSVFALREHRRHQDRIAADRPPLGIPVPPGPRRRTARAPAAPAPSRTSPSSRRRELLGRTRVDRSTRRARRAGAARVAAGVS